MSSTAADTDACWAMWKEAASKMGKTRGAEQGFWSGVVHCAQWLGETRYRPSVAEMMDADDPHGLARQRRTAGLRARLQGRL